MRHQWQLTVLSCYQHCPKPTTTFLTIFPCNHHLCGDGVCICSSSLSASRSIRLSPAWGSVISLQRQITFLENFSTSSMLMSSSKASPPSRNSASTFLNLFGLPSPAPPSSSLASSILSGTALQVCLLFLSSCHCFSSVLMFFGPHHLRSPWAVVPRSSGRGAGVEGAAPGRRCSNWDRCCCSSHYSWCFFFLCCRIALDSCGQVIARSQKEIEIQLTYRKQHGKTQQHQQTEARVS